MEFDVLSGSLILGLSGSVNVPVAMTHWVCDTGLETEDEVVGGWTALLGPGLGLTPVETLAMPAYLARIA